MADQPQAEAPAAKAAGSNKLLLIVGMLVAAGGSGGATYFLTRPKEAPPGQEAKVASKAHAPSEGSAEDDDDGESAAEEGGKEHPVVNLPPFLVNLGDDFNEPHYLKVSVAVEVDGEGEEAAKSFEGKSARVRGAVLMFLSGLKLEDVQGIENRKKIVTGVRKEVRHAAGRKNVRDVFITEMVVQ